MPLTLHLVSHCASQSCLVSGLFLAPTKMSCHRPELPCWSLTIGHSYMPTCEPSARGGSVFFSLDIVIFNGLPCQCSKDSLQDPKRVEDCTLTSHFRHFDRSEGRDVRMIFRQVACMGCPRESHIVHRAPSGHRSTWFSAMNCTGQKCYPHKKGAPNQVGH